MTTTEISLTNYECLQNLSTISTDSFMLILRLQVAKKSIASMDIQSQI